MRAGAEHCGAVRQNELAVNAYAHGIRADDAHEAIGGGLVAGGVGDGVGYNILGGLCQVNRAAVIVDCQLICRCHIVLVPDLVALIQFCLQLCLRGALGHIDGAVVKADGRRVIVDAAHCDHLEAFVARGVRRRDGEGAVFAEGDCPRGVCGHGVVGSVGTYLAAFIHRDRRLDLIVFLDGCDAQSRRSAVDACDGDGNCGRVASLIVEKDRVGPVPGKGDLQRGVRTVDDRHRLSLINLRCAVVGRSDRFTRTEHHNSLIGGIRAAHRCSLAVIALYDHLIDLWLDLVDDGDPVERYRCALAVGCGGGEGKGLVIIFLECHRDALGRCGDRDEVAILTGNGMARCGVFCQQRMLRCFISCLNGQLLHCLAAVDVRCDVGVERPFRQESSILHVRRRPADGQLRRLGVDAGDGLGRAAGVARNVAEQELNVAVVRHIVLIGVSVDTPCIRRSIQRHGIKLRASVLDADEFAIVVHVLQCEGDGFRIQGCGLNQHRRRGRRGVDPVRYGEGKFGFVGVRGFVRHGNGVCARFGDGHRVSIERCALAGDGDGEAGCVDSVDSEAIPLHITEGVEFVVDDRLAVRCEEGPRAGIAAAALDVNIHIHVGRSGILLRLHGRLQR